MATRGSLQQLLASIQSARGAAPTPPPGVNPPPANSYHPAEFYRHDGHPGYAAQLWMSRHPFAVQNGQIPAWVTQAMHGVLGSGGQQNPFTPNPGTPNPVMTPHQGATSGTPNLGFGHYSGAAGGPALGGPTDISPTAGQPSLPGPTSGGSLGPPSPTGGSPTAAPAYGDVYGGPTDGAPAPPSPTSGGPTLSPQLAAQRALLGYA